MGQQWGKTGNKGILKGQGALSRGQQTFNLVSAFFLGFNVEFNFPPSAIAVGRLQSFGFPHRPLCACLRPPLKNYKNTFYKFFAAANINKKELFREFLRG